MATEVGLVIPVDLEKKQTKGSAAGVHIICTCQGGLLYSTCGNSLAQREVNFI